MVSRKKNKGKERKAKKIESKRARAREEWKRWARGEDDQGRKIVKCNHGANLLIPENNHPVLGFMDACFQFQMSVSDNMRSTFQHHLQVWHNEGYRKMAKSFLIRIGVNRMICHDFTEAVDIAIAILGLENYDGRYESIILSRAVATKRRDLLTELALGGGRCGRDTLKFYRKRMDCKCLKDVHLQARKTIQKMARCFHCDEMKQRSLMRVCSRCRISEYCSRECQVANWCDHKPICDKCVCL